MKTWKEFLNEGQNSRIFKKSVKFPVSDFLKWQKSVPKGEFNYDEAGDLILVYKGKLHIATYNTKSYVLDTDNTEWFGK